MRKTKNRKFSIGRLLATPGVLEEVPKNEIVDGVNRHIRGDWGEVCEEDKQLNDQALINGSRLLSAYLSASGVRFWVITEADRSATTVLLPSEY